MLFTRFFYYMRGYLLIKVTGNYPERFLNVCAKRRILIWDVFPCSQTVLRCRISNRGFRLLPPIARKTGVRIKIIKKCGLSELLKRGKKRKWFVGGMIGFLLVLVVMNQFIWKIEIVGCETVSAASIKTCLEECGLKIGAFRPFLDEKKLQTKMLVRMSELSWIWVNKSGSKVIVQVKERIPKPEIFDTDAFSNVVASKDCLIESMIVKSGVPMVKIGDTVRQGDILISGLILSEKGVEPRKVQCEAEIYGRVWYEKTRAFSLWQPKKNETGRKEKKIVLRLFGHRIPLYIKDETEFSEYAEETREFEANLFGKFLGVGALVKTYREETTSHVKLTAESVAESGGLQIKAEFDEQAAPNAVEQEYRMTYTVLDEDTIEVTVVAEYLEDVAKKIYLE